MTTDIGKLPTQKQIEWIDLNRPDIMDAALVGCHLRCDRPEKDRILYYAIMHKVTEAVDRMGGVRYDCDFGWSGLIVRSGSSVDYPTRFQAELAALGAPEEVVNDG